MTQSLGGRVVDRGAFSSETSRMRVLVLVLVLALVLAAMPGRVVDARVPE